VIHEWKVDREADPTFSAEEYLTKLLCGPDEGAIGSNAHDAMIVVENMSAFAGRLAARNVVIASLDCDCVVSGDWSLQLYNGEATDRTSLPKGFAVLVAWNGANRGLPVAVSPLNPGRNPDEFRVELEQTLSPLDDPISAAESYLFAGGAPGVIDGARAGSH
jgi:hypothetical protein